MVTRGVKEPLVAILYPPLHINILLASFHTCLITDVLKMSSPGILIPPATGAPASTLPLSSLLKMGLKFKQDNMLWLTWLYCPNHDEYSTEDADADLNSWLLNTRPSVVQKSDGIGWISFAIRGGNRGPKNDPDKAMELWELEETPKNIASLVRIAKESPCLSGKWLIFLKPDGVDQVWQDICLAMARNHFEGDVSSAKVSPRALEDDIDGQNHVICVYTKDFTNRKQCLKVERKLRELGISENLRYKPDLYTHLGIYRNNPWKIKANVYNSNYHHRSKTSQISFSLTSGMKITVIN